MIGALKRNIQETKYRMKLRKELQQIDIELLRITREETLKEIDRRNKKK